MLLFLIKGRNLKGQPDDFNDQRKQTEDEHQQCQQFCQIHSISPSLRLQGSGSGTYKKVLLPRTPASFHVGETACGTESMTTDLANQRLIVRIAYFPVKYNV